MTKNIFSFVLGVLVLYLLASYGAWGWFDLTEIGEWEVAKRIVVLLISICSGMIGFCVRQIIKLG